MVPKRNRTFKRPAAQHTEPPGDQARRWFLSLRALHERHQANHDSNGHPRDFIDND